MRPCRRIFNRRRSARLRNRRPCLAASSNSESCNSLPESIPSSPKPPRICAGPSSSQHSELQLEMNHCPKHDAVARTSCRLKHILPATSSTSPCSSDPHALICLLVPRRRTGEFLLLPASFEVVPILPLPSPIVRLPSAGLQASLLRPTAAGGRALLCRISLCTNVNC